MVDDYIKLLQLHSNDNYKIQNKIDNINFYLEQWDKVFFDNSTNNCKEQKICLGLAYPDIVLKKLFDEKMTAKHILLMSGTYHDKKILNELFDIDPYIVHSGAKIPGKVTFVNSKRDWITYTTWKDKDIQSKHHENIHDIIALASRKNEKILIQTPAKKYVEMIKRDPRHTTKLLYDGYTEDGENSKTLQEWFDNPKKEILVSTRTSRGVDLKDNKCRHIIIAKYPRPSLKSPKLQALKMRFNRGEFWHIYNDITTRTLLQQIARGSRNKKDWVKIYTPDSKASIKILELYSKFDNFKLETTIN